jgi:hypothetical protein
LAKQIAIGAIDKSHPDYHDGYFAGLHDQFHRGESTEYEAGYKNGQWAREMFERHGFRPTSNGFQARFSTRGTA